MSSSQHIKLAVIGCGRWGANHIRNFHRCDVLAAVCDANPGIAEQVATDYQVEALSFEDILNRKDINAIAITTPGFAHFDGAQAALMAKKHVFVEKPLSLSMHDAQTLFDLADKQGVILMAGHMLHFHPVFNTIKQKVRNGELGELKRIHSTRLNYTPIKREEDILWGFAPHDISMILALTGQPNHVEARGSLFSTQANTDTLRIMMDYDQPLKADIFVSWHHPYKEQKLIVIGDKSAIVFDDCAPWGQKCKQMMTPCDWYPGQPLDIRDSMPVMVPEGEPLLLECEHFIECIRSGKAPLTGREEALAVQRVLDMACHSRRPTLPQDGLRAYQMRFPNANIHANSYVGERCNIGRDVNIDAFCSLSDNITIGDNTHIHSHCTIGNHVSIGQHCRIEAGARIAPDYQENPTPTIIPDHSIIKANDIIPAGSGASESLEMT